MNRSLVKHPVLAWLVSCLSLLLSLAPAPAESADDPNLVAYWSFDTDVGEGRTITDDTGNGFDATRNGGTSLTPDGIAGQALSFDGVDGFLNVPMGVIEGRNVGDFRTNDFTISFWIKTTVVGQVGVIGKREFCYSHSFWDFRMNSRMNLAFCRDFKVSNCISFTPQISLNDGAWHHLAVTRVGATITSYIDGIWRAEEDTGEVIDLSNLSDLFIGKSRCTLVDGTGFYKGLLDEIRIYDGALSSAEIQDEYDAVLAKDNTTKSSVASSNHDFSGTQGDNDWFYGYRNLTADGGGTSYDPEASFIEFEQNLFTGAEWVLDPEGAALSTELGLENTHPNGSNNDEVHWTIRRWVANSLTETTPMALHWHFRKSDTGGGNGVTGALYINGEEKDRIVIAGTDRTGKTHTFYANLEPGDIVDLIHSPRGADGNDNDGQDGSINWLRIDPTLPKVAFQPDGSVFIPVGADDADGDGMTDSWERLFFPNDLTQLSTGGDFDRDGLTDLLEFERDSDPTKADTDGDGLSDLIETSTGVFVSNTNTGSDPTKADTDNDGLSDGDEATGSPATNPNKQDTDGDGFSDAEELAGGSDPNDPQEFPLRVEPVAFDVQQGTVTLVWGSQPGVTYAIDVSQDLKTWRVLNADLPSQGERTTFTLTIHPDAPVRFLRLRQ